MPGTSNNALLETSSAVGIGSHPGHLTGGHGGHTAVTAAANGGGNNNLNINLPENNNAILRLEVELRDKNVPKYRRGGGGGRGSVAAGDLQSSWEVETAIFALFMIPSRALGGFVAECLADHL